MSLDVPILLYRGMSEAEYKEAKANGFFQSDQHRYDNARLQIELDRIELSKTTDPETRESIEASIQMWEGDLATRQLAGEFDLTFWSDSYADAANYGEVVVTIRTAGIERQFEPFDPRRPGEWVTAEPVPFSAMHGAQLQLHKRFPPRMARRPDVRVRAHQRKFK